MTTYIEKLVALGAEGNDQSFPYVQLTTSESQLAALVAAEVAEAERKLAEAQAREENAKCANCGHVLFECVERDAAIAAAVAQPPAWQLVTKEFLVNPPEWFDAEFWCFDGSRVGSGRYEWRQGWSPDRIHGPSGDVHAIGVYVMPLITPTPPAPASLGGERKDGE
jgi:hypothetical protein